MFNSRRRLAVLAACVLAGSMLAAPRAQQQSFMPIDEVEPGMVAIGRTIFEGSEQQEFRAHILGVLRNITGPGRDLVLARLEGGPLAQTGVMQGMSGSPVYVDGRLIGAVSYQLGSFPREPIAGITPIAEMIEAVDLPAPRVSGDDLTFEWPATAEGAIAALGRVAARARAPLGHSARGTSIVGPASLADMAPDLRPIGASMVISGFNPLLDRRLRQALSPNTAADQAARSTPAPLADTGLRPGDPVGMSLIRGDMEMGATGTVTWVDGPRVYAFGHPYLNLGPTQMAMTEAHVITYLPSLDASQKITTMGQVIGTIGQDRATAVGGLLGSRPKELAVRLTLAPARGEERAFEFQVLQDPQLTSLFAYVAVFNTLVAYERQSGELTISATGTLSFGDDGEMAFDDFFSGPAAIGLAAGALTNAIGAAASNTFKPVEAERLDLRFEIEEAQKTTAIERVWLDTTRPVAGSTHTVHVLLRDYQGDTETVSIPLTMPARPRESLTLLVSDASTLAARQQRDLKPGSPNSWPSLLARLKDRPRNNRLYVRLIASETGTVVAGETLPALPPSVRSVLDSDPTVTSAPVTQTVIGAWEHQLDRAVQGSRELKFALTVRD